MLMKNLRIWTSYLSLSLGAFAILIGTAAASKATIAIQDKCAGTIHAARYVPGGAESFVSLDERINAADLSPGGQEWTLADLSVKPVRDIPVLRAEPDNRANQATFTTIKLIIAGTLIKDHLYRV